MVDTQQKNMRIDHEGKVLLVDVVSQLRELQDEIQANMNQIKARKINISKQNLLSPKTFSIQPKPSHLKLVTSNIGQQKELLPAQEIITETKEKSFQTVPEQFHQKFRLDSDGQKFTSQKNPIVGDSLPEMEELKEIISLLEKLDD